MRDDRPNPFEDGRIPRWASAWGQDRCGIWVAFEIEGVPQVLRWIGPGSFLIGSPEDEPGRHDDEGPQHEVTFSRGFWLADTPCTQALWCAVMGAESNPSRFVDPRRPVEQVSLDDVQAFLAECERRVPGLGLRLPTEAEWEYACRAGTTTATYAGPIEILGSNNAPVLDAIAWYGGNSGVNFDLEEGHDSAAWPEKQYPHSKTGTRWVRQRRRNPWGLYDMLGNVWEWCGNDLGPYSADSIVDPEVGGDLSEEHSSRVVRGGSWSDDAQRVRAAYRDADRREDRGEFLGFRFARGRASGGRGPEGPSRTGFVVSSAPSEGGRSPSGAALERRVRTADIPGPTAGDPYWQEDQDEFGVYADVRVPETQVDFRMRFIELGTFLMGSPEDDAEAFDREKPQHQVTLTQGFWLADAPCTQAVYEAVAGANPSSFRGSERPVESVSWDEAQAFLRGLSERMSGAPFVLPTEAQWEYACRAGTTNVRYGEPDAVAWYAANADSETHSVKQKLPNPRRLYDMLGNIFEWCVDEAPSLFEPHAYTDQPRTDPVGGTKGSSEPSYRVVRGGSWSDFAQGVRAAYRSAYRRGFLGFRFARG